MFCLEKIEETIGDESLTGSHVRNHAEVNERVGIGVSEAPRGTLFHEYKVDREGILQYVNLMIATGQNNLAMNKTVQQIARAYIDGNDHPRRRAEPHRARHPPVRPLPELLDPRRRPDAAACAVDLAGRGSGG